jgi:hypothetical protein
MRELVRVRGTIAFEEEVERQIAETAFVVLTTTSVGVWCPACSMPPLPSTSKRWS